MAIDYSTAAGKVRLLIPDTNEATPAFTDAQIAAFLSIESDNVKRAAAAALETAASNTVLVKGVLKLLEIETDGAKESDALLKKAAQLRKQADDADAADLLALEDQHFDIAEQVVDVFTLRERIYNQALRGES